MLVFLVIYGIQYWDNTGVKEFIFSMLASAWWVFLPGLRADGGDAACQVVLGKY